MNKIRLSIAAIILMILLVACNQNDETSDEAEERITPVETAEVTKGDLVVEKSVYGRTAPNSTTPIIVQNPGKVNILEVENGDIVEEDDLIATIQSPAGNQNIYASADGEITNLNAEEGAMVSDSEPLAVIAELETIKLQFTVTSTIRELFEKETSYPALINDTEYEAEVTSISTMPDDTGLYPVEATIDNDDGDVLPGMIAVMQVTEQRINNTILVPTAAIVEETDDSFVYIIKNDEAIKTQVTITETQSDQTAIEGEVSEGGEVVINGQLTLSDGSKVNVKEGNNS
ncbi:efflux RND transporter periplasmic adaptor subunit [Virgibacillus byunsanensis]|uniref:Efflux RND transporter periplasmic adaptor subunit n=1 Tax=Virgibacillus byunsanensis TaxID=570945 RepID=A0ABW3LHT2_9BACI